MAQEQTHKNHARVDPKFHYFVMPVLLLNFLFAIYALVRHFPNHVHLFGWWIVVSLALLTLAVTLRSYATKVQDRIIRLEERLRYAALLSPEQLRHTEQISDRQIIALRFASDAELPKLLKRTVTEGLDPKNIKLNVAEWRADNHRV